MGLRRRLRQFLDGKNGVVEKASKIEKEALPIDPQGRIADLKATGADITIEVERIGSDGRGFQNKNFEMDEVDPVTFRELIGEHLGGGNYRVGFRKADGHLLIRTDNGKPETHKIKVGGMAKGREKAERAEKKTDEASDPSVYKIVMEQQGKNMELVTTMLTTMITALLTNQGNGKGDPSAIVKSMIEGIKEMKAVAGDGGVDPLTLVSGVMQLMKQYEMQTRAPVQTTGSNSSGMDKFFEGLGQAVPAFAPLIASRLNPGTGPAALPADTNPTGRTEAPVNVSGLDTPASAEAAPSSTTPPDNSQVVVPLDPLAALDAPLGELEGGGGDSSHAAYGALMKLRYVIAQRDDPYSVAAEMVDSVNLILGSQRIAGRWQNFITDDNAGDIFDQYAPMIPEFAADPAFMAECRAALIEAVHEQLNPDSESMEEAEEEEAAQEIEEEAEAETEDEAEPAGEAQDEVDDSTDESKQVPTGTPEEHDRFDGNSRHDEGEADDG